MSKALRHGLGGLFLILTAACGEPPAPEDPPQPPSEPEPPPEPAKPTCKAMKDRCTAEADTAAAIPKAKHTFTPPLGWEYALLEEATVTQQSDEGAVLALTTLVTDKAAYKANPQRTAMVTSLAELIDVVPPSKIDFSRPKKRKMGTMTMELWEAEAKRGGKTGALLILSANVGERDIFGIGFAVSGDIEGTQAILVAIETFKPEGETDAAANGDDGKKK